MKRILLVLVAACSMEAPPAGKPPAAAGGEPREGSASPITATTRPPLFCTEHLRDRPFAGRDEAALYCAHVDDGCCEGAQWICNNTRYDNWYVLQCGR